MAGFPAVPELSLLFTPQSFLTAIKQTAARANNWALDQLTWSVEVTRFTGPGDVGEGAGEGVYVSGLSLEGCRWDPEQHSLAESIHGELTPALPVLHVRAVPMDQHDTTGLYECPVYLTRRRGPGFVFAAGLRSSVPVAKWVLAGVCGLLDAE